MAFVIDVVPDITCPNCGAEETHPTMKIGDIPDSDHYHEEIKQLPCVVIRAFKVDNYSQCLRCSGFYNDDLTVAPEGSHDPEKGWF